MGTFSNEVSVKAGGGNSALQNLDLALCFKDGFGMHMLIKKHQ